MNNQSEIRLFNQIYKDALYAPLLRWNPKYKTEEYNGMTPYICIKDICDYKYVVCAIPDEEVTMTLQEMSRRNVIVEYGSVEEMVEDGWRLDT